MSGIQPSRLREIAEQKKAHLYVHGEGDQREVQVGSFNGRQMRNLTGSKLQHDVTDFGAATTEVRKTLRSMYGEDIGTKVFNAHIGRLKKDGDVFSESRPISSRRIRDMIKDGDRALLERHGNPENGGTQFRQALVEPRDRDQATIDWMLRKSLDKTGPSDESPPILDPTKRNDRRSMELHGATVPGEPRVLKDGGPLAQRLVNDLGQRMLESRRSSYDWTLMVTGDDTATRPLGLHVDRKDPGMVKIFDSDHTEVTVPHDDLGRWLDVHLRQHCRNPTLLLLRAEETTTDSRFVAKDGAWTLHRNWSMPPQTLKQELLEQYFEVDAQKEPKTIGKKPDQFGVCHQFLIDLPRTRTPVRQGDVETVLDPNNAPTQMLQLLGVCSEDGRRHGMFNLPLLLNQSLGNALSLLAVRTQANEFGTELSGRNFIPDVTVTKNGGVLRFDIEQIATRTGFDRKDDLARQPLDLTSRMRCAYSVEISLDALRQPNGFRHFEIVEGPVVDLDLKTQVGSRLHDPNGDNHKMILVFRDGERLVSSELGDTRRKIESCRQDRSSITVNGQALSEDFVIGITSRPESVMIQQNGVPILVTLEHDKPGRLSDLTDIKPAGIQTLSFLLAPPTSHSLHEGLLKDALKQPDFVIAPNDIRPRVMVTPTVVKALVPAVVEKVTPTGVVTEVAPSTLEDVNALEIEYRLDILEGTFESNPLTVFHHVSEPPKGRIAFESVVKIRIPVEQLNAGNLGAFEQVHPGRLEGRCILDEQ